MKYNDEIDLCTPTAGLINTFIEGTTSCT